MPTPSNAAALLLPTLDPKQQERVHCLWDELAGHEAARTDEALMHLLGAVAQMTDAQNAYWMGTVRITDDENDRLCGWRPRLIRYLRPFQGGGKCEQRLGSHPRGGIDEATIAHARLAGKFRAGRWRDLVSPAWFAGQTYRDYQKRNIHDALVVAVPVNPMAEAYYGFWRMRPGESFSETERDIGYYAMRGLTKFHRQVLTAHGLAAAGSPLSPTERRVLTLLLTDKSEKLIAAELGVTTSTAHTYVRGVLRKLGVSGRTGLTSLWLGRKN